MSEDKYWEQHSHKINEYYYSYETGIVKADILSEKIIKILGDIEGKSILKTDLYEDAFGSDQLINRTEFEKSFITGIDISLNVTSLAKSKMGSGLNRYVNCDVMSLPFKNNEFDVILSVSTLDHFDDVSDFKKSIHELMRVLKQNGLFLLILDNKLSLFYYTNVLKKYLKILPFKLGKTFLPWEVKNMFRDSQMEVVRVGYGLFAPINYFPRFFNMLTRKYSNRYERIIRSLDKIFGIFPGRFAAAFNFILIQKSEKQI